MTKPRKNIITDARMYDIAMQMKGTPVSYPKPTRMQRFKKWLRYQKGDIRVLCAMVVCVIIVSYISPSPIIAFILSIPIGMVIGIILIDIFG